MEKDFTTWLLMNAIERQRVKLQEQGKSDEEIKQIQSHIDFSEIITKITDEMAIDSTHYFEKVMYKNVLQDRARTAEFLAQNDRIWQEGFVVSEALHAIVLERAKKIDEYAKNMKERPREEKVRFRVLRELFGRACQQYLEIIFLLKAGFADGAYARWRSLYEISVIADFISNNDGSVAEAYYTATFSGEDRYIWARAAPCFSEKRKITFEDIKKHCRFANEKWTQHYRTANKIIHASPQGTFRRIGDTPTRRRMISVGHSVYGLAVPAINAAISLAVVASILFLEINNGDSIAYIKSTSKWVDIIRQKYVEIENRHFKE